MKTIKLRLEDCSNNSLNGLIVTINKFNDTCYKFKNTNIKVIDTYNEIETMQKIYSKTGSKVYWDLKLIIQFPDKIIFINKVSIIDE